MRRFFVLALLLLLLVPPAQAAPRTGGTIRYLYVVPLSHLDIGFTASPPEVAALQKRYLDDAITYAEREPLYHWTVESIWQYDQWAARTTGPDWYERLKAQIAAGKIELAAGYVNSHQGQWGAEEANRFLYPARKVGLDLGVPIRTAIVNDVPGSSWALPQILAANGVHNLIAGTNVSLGGELELPVADSLFTWVGVDGSAVLTWVSRESYAEGIFTYQLSARYADMQAATQRMIDFYESAGYPYDAIIVLHGFDNAGPELLRSAYDNIERWNREHAWPQIVVATASQFFDHVRAVHGDRFSRYQGDWSGRWETNDAYVPSSTALVRRTKSAAPAAETLASLDRLLGLTAAPDPAAAFDGVVRRQLIFDEHSGAGQLERYATASQTLRNAQWFAGVATQTSDQTEALLAASLRTLAGAVRTEQTSLVVLNPLPWPRSDLVRVARSALPAAGRPPTLVDLATGALVPTQLADGGQALVFRADDLPAFGYKLYGLAPTGAPAAPPGAVRASGSPDQRTIENEFYRVAVDAATGNVRSIFDKRAGRELVRAGGAFRFNGAVSANQDNAFVWGNSQPVPSGTVQVSVATGPVFAVLRIERTGTPFTRTEIRLAAGLPRVEIANTLDRSLMAFVPHQQHTRWYFYTFPFDLGAGFVARFQGPNGFLRPQADWLPGTRHNARVSRTVTDLRAADGFGVSVANRETYLSSLGTIGFWSEAEPAEPTLFPVAVAKQDELYTADRGWVTASTLEPGLPSVYTARFALTSSAGGFDPVAASRFGAGFNLELLALMVPANPTGALVGPSASLLATDQPNVVVTTLKGAEFEDPDGRDFILRLQEIAGRATAGVQLVTPVRFASAELNGLGEQRADAVPLPTDPLRFDIGPYQTLTIRVRGAAR